MSCALHGFAPSTSLWRRGTCRHGLHTSNGTAGRLAMKSNNTYHVEVLLGEDEPPENALKRFRWATKCTGLVMEARRRMRFENRQDEKKRRIKEGHLKKSKRYTPPPRYEEVVTTLEPAPFADMFSEVQDFLGEANVPGGGNGNTGNGRQF